MSQGSCVPMGNSRSKKNYTFQEKMRIQKNKKKNGFQSSVLGSLTASEPTQKSQLSQDQLLLVVGSQAIVWSTPSQVWKLELWIAWRLMLLITDFFSRLAVSMPAHMGDAPFQALSMLRLKFKSRRLLFKFKILQEQLKIRVSSNVSWWLSVKNFFPHELHTNLLTTLCALIRKFWRNLANSGMFGSFLMEIIENHVFESR